MSGIVGYIGPAGALARVLAGMRRFEYRSYDSAGMAWLENSGLQSAKIIGGIEQFEKQLITHTQDVPVAIGHTRWATHGDIILKNTHPHFDATHNIALVHKGVIENYTKLKQWLHSRGHFFVSDTDSEVLAHLIGELYQGDILDATRMALQLIEGSYSIGVLCATEPERIIIARRGQPLVLGFGDGEMMFASSVDAVAPMTRSVQYIDDNAIVEITRRGHTVFDTAYALRSPDFESIQEEVAAIRDPEGFANAMEREIYEQPKSLEQVMKGRLFHNGTDGITLPALDDSLRQLLQYERIIITACGASWHAGIVGKYILEELLGVSVALEYAPEFRYRSIPLDAGAIVLVLSQSGEDPDTVAAMQRARTAGMFTIGITNVPGSTVSRETDCGMHLRVGSQLGMSPTKTFSAEVMAFALFGMYLAKHQGLTIDQAVITECRNLPEKISTALVRIAPQIEELADTFVASKQFLILGQGYGLPVALEGGFKLRDVARKHVEFYHAAEQKIGQRLVEPGTPVIAIINHDESYSAILETLRDIKEKGGRIIALVPEHDDHVEDIAEFCINLPETMQLLSPILTVLPLQLLAYYIAKKQGIDVDAKIR